MPQTTTRPNIGNYRKKPTILQSIGNYLKWLILVAAIVGGFLFLYGSISKERHRFDQELKERR
jgi:hypothetical protein